MKELKLKIGKFRQKFDQASAEIQDDRSLQKLRNLYLGRKQGFITQLLEEMKTLQPEEKPVAGQLINDLKTYINAKLQAAQKAKSIPRGKQVDIDLTLPGKRTYWGAPHPILLYLDRVERIFQKMGFSIVGGPEIETDYYNFEALNFPPHHPARDDWDTLYIKDDLLLRTHTSPVQIRVMEKRKPPIRIINPGKVFRKETPDPTHLPMFYQVEGLVVDHGITFTHLKGTLEVFLKALYHEKIKIRFRPSFFPFTEPSAEVDIGCTVWNRMDRDSWCRYG